MSDRRRRVVRDGSAPKRRSTTVAVIDGIAVRVNARAIPQEIADMIRRGRASQDRQTAMRECIRLLTDAFLSVGASLTECADICEGECARRRLEHEQRKLAERKVRR